MSETTKMKQSKPEQVVGESQDSVNNHPLRVLKGLKNKEFSQENLGIENFCLAYAIFCLKKYYCPQKH